MAGQTTTTTWILVSDAARARLFSESTPGGGFTLVAEFDHPESRERSRDLTTDAVGRKPVGGSRGVSRPPSGSHGSYGPGTRPGGFHGRPGAEPDTDAKEVEAEKFARELADALEKGCDAHFYDTLVITAPPHFLGMLKETISDKVRKRLVQTMDKDLSLLQPRDIEQRVRAQRAA